MDVGDRPVRVLELAPNASWDSLHFKLQTGWVLKFMLAPCLYPNDIHLYTDYPAPGTLYERGKMRELQWTFSTRQPTWDPDRYVEIELEFAGPYRFTFSRNSEQQEGSGFFLVEPNLGYSPQGICAQTYITKLMGPFAEWKDRLQVGKEAGYNMFHFTPIQQLGSSRSAYSISNHLRMDSTYFETSHTPSEVAVKFKDQTGADQTLMVDSSYVRMRELVKTLSQEWGVLSMVDVVWNHTAFDTPWLIQHPEVGYNLINSPHLRPAYALDVALATFSRDIAEGKWSLLGIQPEVENEGQIHNISCRLLDTVFPQARLWEYSTCDVEVLVDEFRTAVYRLNGGSHARPEGKRLHIVQDKQYRRLASTFDIDLALELFNIDWPGMVCFEERIERCCDDLREELRRLNAEIQDRVTGQLHRAVSNLAANVRYQFLESHGPRRKRVTPEEPLFPRYFCMVGGGNDLGWSDLESPRGEYVLAHNGWVMNADPLVNFAAEGTKVYFQRELIVWGDSIKLRYGEGPSDSPWLWDYMRRYTQLMAWIFDAFRIDNCHNTPMNVAEGLLDAGRQVNPNLYLVAELFTSSEDKDNYFVNRLGINSLIREAMFASYPRELGRLVFKYGGSPVASFLPPSCNAVLKPTTTNALFMDATHDNDPGHILSRSVYDVLPNTALTAIASCASGGCRGYDELVPHMINVVKENRVYSMWKASNGGTVTGASGILRAKAKLNQLHQELADQGFSQIYVDQVTEEIVAVTRHCPSSHQSVILMAHTAFNHPEHWAVPTVDNPHTHYHHVPPLTVPGVVTEVILEARLVKQSGQMQQFEKHPSYINGMECHQCDMRTHIPLEKSEFCRLVNQSSTQEVQFNEFCPGSIIVFRVSLVPEANKAVKLIRSFLGQSTDNAEGCGLRQKLEQCCDNLDLLDLNYALYRCDQEERDDGQGGGTYEVPGAGSFVYCGLQGIMSMLAKVRDNNDLGHPICDNLRAGDWMAGYAVNRLKLREGTKKLGDCLSAVFSQLSKLPRYLNPCYFAAIVTTVHDLLTESAVAQMGRFVQNGSSFIKRLALGSVQLYGVCRSSRLPPPTVDNEPLASLAAGLPHFSTGFMRCWGRDTFIALRGMLMVTDRFQDAWDNILSFASCIRHGLLPNLLNGGTNPRYNCRDAPWWWLQSVQDYITLAPQGSSILHADVRRLYRHDDASADFDSHEAVPLSEIIQEVLQKHVNTIQFRERGAGPNLDKDMTPPGFDVRAGVDLETGFVYGGSVHNCGTWMDKVGESSWAGNKGTPSTPRDGSAVELVGLCYSTVTFLAKLSQQSIYPHSGIKLNSQNGGGSGGSPKILTFAEWGKRIKANFETRFWVPTDKGIAVEREGSDSGYIHRTGIYKDSVGATQRYADFQLRPNFPIAMTVSPELFTPENAWEALQRVEQLLLGPLGVKTLDPHDYVYNGYYINSVDSSNYNTARGFNYHQGPEWLWVVGYFLRAKLKFAHKSGISVEDTISSIHRVLGNHAQALRDSPWQGLPELTNKDGVECSDSCPVQAWSMATLLDILFDLKQFN